MWSAKVVLRILLADENSEDGLEVAEVAFIKESRTGARCGWKVFEVWEKAFVGLWARKRGFDGSRSDRERSRSAGATKSSSLL